MNFLQVNIDLVRALGINDPNGVRKVTLVIEAGQPPMISVDRFVKTADGLQTAVEMLRLQPVEIQPVQIKQSISIDQGVSREEITKALNEHRD